MEQIFMPILEVKRTLGILGGVGPLASSKFVETIYLFATRHLLQEQLLPRIILYSDPTVPDRTEWLESGLENDLLRFLISGLSNLIGSGADRIVICCFTFHYLLEYLPKEMIKYIIPLPSIALAKIADLKIPSLLLCSKATNNLKIFEKDKLWECASQYIILPNTSDQLKIHDLIYEIKMNKNLETVLYTIEQLLEKYQVNSWIAGCTEFHIISNLVLNNSNYKNQPIIIDPLLILAEHVGKYFDTYKNTLDFI